MIATRFSAAPLCRHRAIGHGDQGAQIGDRFDNSTFGRLQAKFCRDGGFRTVNLEYDNRRPGLAGFRMDRLSSPRGQVTLQADAYTGEPGQSSAIAIFSTLCLGRRDGRCMQGGLGEGATFLVAFIE